jgi:DNA-binding NtrC family response regulator
MGDFLTSGITELVAFLLYANVKQSRSCLNVWTFNLFGSSYGDELGKGRWGMCILIVEDEADLREMLVVFLGDAGFRISEASTADAAIPLLDLEDLRLVITEIELPGRFDGLYLAFSARRIRPGIPVIFISGRPANLEEGRGFDGPAAFVQKPFRFKTLVEEVLRLADVAFEASAKVRIGVT